MTCAWDNAKNLLCIRLDAIGDVLMTTPAIRALKTARPDRHITLLTSPAGVGIAALVPEIDDVLVYDAPWMKATAPRQNSQPELAMVDRLKQGEFDGAVIFTVYSQNPLPAALLCYLADIPLRLAHCHENPYQLLTDWVLDPEPGRGIRHEVQRQLDLVGTVGCRAGDERLSLQVRDADREFVSNLLAGLGIDHSRPWTVIHPGSTAPSRCYNPASFAEVARRLTVDRNCQVLFTGVEAERALIEGIQKQMGVSSRSLINTLNLGQMAALLAIAPLLISNNTGPVHMAAALGTPVVDLYALTNPQHTPWMVRQRVLYQDVPCKFCYKSLCPEGHHDCLERVTPDQVVRAAWELLQAGRGWQPEARSPLFYTFTFPAASPALATVATQSAQDIWR